VSLGQLIIESISLTSIAEWLIFSGGDDQERRAELEEDIRNRPNIRRFLVRDQGVAVARFATELGRIGMTAWQPRLAEGTSIERGSDVFDNIGTFLVSHGKAEDAAYIECTMKGHSAESDAWKRSLLKNGFYRVSLKCEWRVHIGELEMTTGELSCPEVRVERIGYPNSEAENIYLETLSGSLDASNVLEGEYGEGLGEFHFGYIARHGGDAVGVCVCVSERNAESAWIKYVGTIVSWRRKGVARLLIRTALSALSSSSVTTARALVDENNGPSRALHQKLEFSNTGICGESYYFKVHDPPSFLLLP
jgi:ribosomal protein S18 acetylase RimI-like enzyme